MPVGAYTLQAAIAACPTRARTPEATDWQRIAAPYDVLGRLAPPPVIEVNRAVAHGLAYGPAAGLDILAPLADDPGLATSHLLPGVRADLLARADNSG